MGFEVKMFSVVRGILLKCLDELSWEGIFHHRHLVKKCSKAAQLCGTHGERVVLTGDLQTSVTHLCFQLRLLILGELER